MHVRRWFRSQVVGFAEGHIRGRVFDSRRGKDHSACVCEWPKKKKNQPEKTSIQTQEKKLLYK